MNLSGKYLVTGFYTVIDSGIRGAVGEWAVDEAFFNLVVGKEFLVMLIVVGPLGLSEEGHDIVIIV